MYQVILSICEFLCHPLPLLKSGHPALNFRLQALLQSPWSIAKRQPQCGENCQVVTKTLFFPGRQLDDIPSFPRSYRTCDGLLLKKYDQQRCALLQGTAHKTSCKLHFILFPGLLPGSKAGTQYGRSLGSSPCREERNPGEHQTRSTYF